MPDLLYTELLKLKRSKMFLVSILGAAAVPFMCFIGYLGKRSKNPDVPIQFNEVFSETNMYIVLLIGVLLYGVIASYLFNREYIENTLKSLLTIPVSKMSFILSKFIMLLVWIMTLTIAAWGLTLILGLIGHFKGLSSAVVAESFKQFATGGGLLFLVVTPTIFITLVFKNYVPGIVFTTVITMVNVMMINSEYRALYPWSGVWVIVSNMIVPEYPVEYTYISIFTTFIIGFITTMIYFRKEDV